ncbi:CHC2 zinc finger domain protein [Fulvivirga imtechensis AK7]|uniref:CHC2 zinc finger domain protein n=1 Tax=Fulvivirga imtechensis AK7 TaxID=1237149 RepID=L8JKD8_9BACT|nr:CHC2 zinc finger domain protein [Fulvivirga imtechensis AK7]
MLLIEDLDGVYNAFLPLREFMSKQSITKLTTDKDAKGNNVQKVLTVEGPICVSGATTKEGIYEDNANRSYLLHINEGAGHMEEVMDYQRKLQAGLVDENSQNIAKQLLKNTQRLLKPIKVINPYATQLKIPDSVFKKLRTNMHYLRLIEIITFYHQWQRPRQKNEKGEEYILTTLEDISWANRLVKESLLRKSDELNGQLRSFFEALKALISRRPKDRQAFYSREIREQFRMNPMKANRYLRELEMWGYIRQTGGNRKTGFEYEIAAWDEYQHLQSGIDILDSTLQKLKEKEAKNNSKKSSIT